MDSLHSLDPAADYLQVTRATAADGSTRLVLRGELDGVTAEVFDRAAREALARPATGRIDVHLAGLTFADSAGIRCLVEVRTAAGEAGRELTLVDPSDPVRRVLEISGLTAFFGLARGAEGSFHRCGMHVPMSPDETLRQSETLRAAARESRALASAAVASAPGRAR